jgi:predicted transcriptional regulator
MMLRLGLLRAIAAQEAVRYVITEAGLRFLREFEDVERNLEQASSKIMMESVRDGD